MKVVLLLLILGFATTIIDARFDSNSHISQVVSNGKDKDVGYYVKSTTCTPCCDNCSCTKSIPPQCRCTDVKPTCHSACKSCRCFET